jgi:general secretion pathway protein F
LEFRYVAVNPEGQTVSGQLQASGEREALRALQAQELVPVEIAPAHGPGATRGGRARSATEKDKALVIRQLATLLQAGVSLAESVESLGESNPGTQIGLTFVHVHERLRSGESFSQGLQSGALVWPDYLLHLVTAGEHTGKLAQALQSAATQMEYEQRMKSEMRNALIYPGVLVFSGIAATLLIFLVVVPKFAGILKTSRAQIPDISVWVLSTGMFVKDNLLWVALAAGAAAAGIASLFSSIERRRQALQSLSRAPVLGDWLVQTETGRWAAMLSTLLDNRVPILKAMELAQAGMRLPVLRRKLEQALREVRGGKKLAEALAGVRMLDVTGLNLVRVGERSGQLAAMLRTLATMHEETGRERLKRFLILLEPVAILLIGGVIGLIMVAVMLAITSMTNLRL